jgi:hypothetical protein
LPLLPIVLAVVGLEVDVVADDDVRAGEQTRAGAAARRAAQNGFERT